MTVEHVTPGSGALSRSIRRLHVDPSVDVWLAQLALSPVEVRRLGRTLCDAELARSGRFTRPADRRRYVAAHGLLRQLLGQYLRCAPETVDLCYEPGGKLALHAPTHGDLLHLSISHSADIAMFAFSRHSVVGIDVERVRPVPEMSAVVQDCFSAREQLFWYRLPEDKRHESFFHVWTRKEAVLKAMGTGLAFPPERVEVTCDPDKPARLLRLEDDETPSREWSLESLIPWTGYVGTAASRKL